MLPINLQPVRKSKKKVTLSMLRAESATLMQVNPESKYAALAASNKRALKQDSDDYKFRSPMKAETEAETKITKPATKTTKPATKTKPGMKTKPGIKTGAEGVDGDEKEAQVEGSAKAGAVLVAKATRATRVKTAAPQVENKTEEEAVAVPQTTRITRAKTATKTKPAIKTKPVVDSDAEDVDGGEQETQAMNISEEEAVAVPKATRATAVKTAALDKVANGRVKKPHGRVSAQAESVAMAATKKGVAKRVLEPQAQRKTAFDELPESGED